MQQTKANFSDVSIADIETMDRRELDELDFGVIGIDSETIATLYNETESRLSGLAPERVLGLPFFDAVAQCMNNFLVAQRFEDEPELDEVIPFVLTLRMRPTPVCLRLLAKPFGERRYILIER